MFKRLDMLRDDNAGGNVSFMQKLLDEKGVLWPYPDAQLQWLLKLLNNLDARMLVAVRHADLKWQKERLAWLINC